jgi:hypothetical protein
MNILEATPKQRNAVGFWWRALINGLKVMAHQVLSSVLGHFHPKTAHNSFMLK